MPAVTEQLKEFSSAHGNKPVGPCTTAGGAPVDTITASMTAGKKGPQLMQDFTYLEHIQSFDRERIPERVVHAKGYGAFGYFETTTTDAAKYCKAKMFDTVGKRTPMVARFSTVGGESGTPDTQRDPRGFSLKFYTEEGNWDMVGNNTPIFFVRDPMLFPSFIHTQKRNPVTHLNHLVDPNMFWDFASLRPETLHQMTILFSDFGTPKSARFMHGYGSHTFKNVNAAGEAVWVKYHFKTDQGVLNLPAEMAAELMGTEPDHSTVDLYTAIAEGDYPSWTTYIQVMTLEQAKDLPYAFDLTKVWPQKEFPLIEIGRFTLNRNPTNYFSDVEMAAYDPANFIPGIQPSPDKMLQGRLLSYSDAHRHRLGPNYQQLPINKAHNAQVHHYQRDGFARLDNHGGAPNYYPNSFSGPEPDKIGAWHEDPTTDQGVAARWESGGDDYDNYSQAGILFRKVMDDGARDRLTTNLAGHLAPAYDFIVERVISELNKVDPDYGRMVQEKIEASKKEKPEPKPELKPAPLHPPRTVPNKKQ